jgi:CelD/BcsL family acetyltransferase involved in cellulose biosynthesis
MTAFHQRVAGEFLRRGRLRLHRLDVGGEPIAVIYCFRYGDVVSFYQTGYDARYGRYGPGRRIMAHAVASAIDEGARVFDFLRGDEPYKKGWGAESRHDDRILMPTSARGRAILAARGAVRLMRRLRRRRR